MYTMSLRPLAPHPWGRGTPLPVALPPAPERVWTRTLPDCPRPPAEHWRCWKCQFFNFVFRPDCKRCQAPKVRAAPVLTPLHPARESARPPRSSRTSDPARFSVSLFGFGPQNRETKGRSRGGGRDRTGVVCRRCGRRPSRSPSSRGRPSPVRPPPAASWPLPCPPSRSETLHTPTAKAQPPPAWIPPLPS